MPYVVDSTVMIDFLRGVQGAVSLIRKAVLDSRALWASEISRAEVIAGMREEEREATIRSFRLYDWMAVDKEISERAGEWARRFRKSHPQLALDDLLIASTAEQLGAKLLTLNTRHFPMYEGLEAPY